MTEPSTTISTGVAASSLAASMSFENKVKERLKESIGELMTDDDLRRLIELSLSEMYMKPRPNPDYKHWVVGSPRELPPYLHVLVKEQLQPVMEKMIGEYLSENKAFVEEVIKEILQMGAGMAMVEAMNKKFRDDLFKLQTSISQKL